MNKLFDIRYILLDLLRGSVRRKEKYIFVNNVPVSTGRTSKKSKYNRYARMYKQNELKCKCCGLLAKGFKLVPCESDGYIHEETGLRKHVFMLVDENHNVMTLDHFIPQWFLKKRGLRNKRENWVLMCEECNHFKSDMIPENWKELYNKMK